MPRFRDIRLFTQARYTVHVGWDYLETWLTDNENLKCGLQLNPEFQRGHVWTEAQQVAYLEYRIRGGLGANELFWNCAGWMKLGANSFEGPMYLVDGLQRLTAVRRFMADEIPIFGHKLSEYEDKLDRIRNTFVMAVNDLDNYADVLQWYIDLNAGGVVHSTTEIERVRKLLEKEKEQK